MKKGFTLNELLIVVAIIAVLAIVLILTLNPAMLLQQSRDASRIASIGNLNKAIGLYYSDAINNPSTLFMGIASVEYVSIPDPSATSTAGDQCQGLGLASLPTGWIYHCAATSTYLNVNGTGWIPINFNNYSGGVIISKLSVDPINSSSSNLYYTYTTNGNQYELTAVMESAKYQLGGTNDVISGDGGPLVSVYEKGSQLGLEPLDYGDSSLVGYWPLNEGMGSSTYDWSGNGNTGTWHGTATGTSGYYSAGEVETYAGTFDGTSTYFTASNTASLNPTSISISLWFNQVGLTTNLQGLVTKDIGGSITNAPYVLEFNAATTTLNFSITTQDNVVDSCLLKSTAPHPSLGVWNYVVATYSLATQSSSLYLNGVAVVTSPSSCSGITNIATTTGTLNVGQQKVGLNRFFDGYLDDVRIYNRALSAAQIQAIYNAGK